jgi:signal transduction histidine kinase
LQVSVTDEGMGIPAEDLPGLFQRFHRGANPEVQSISGCGLGLAICRGIVESHGGRVWITSPVALDSRSAPGTAVMFTLPLYVAESGHRQHPRLMPLAEPWRMSS